MPGNASFQGLESFMVCLNDITITPEEIGQILNKLNRLLVEDVSKNSQEVQNNLRQLNLETTVDRFVQLEKALDV